MADAVVQVREGLVEGERVENEFGGSYYSFKGIPFAEPPLDNLRFKPPQPPKPWNGVRSAKEFGPIGYQVDFFKMTPPEGSEDCLYINVYTPDIRPKAPLPVMVWIHGGGFYWGSGNDDVYGPEFLVRQGVILVTFNYRLGVLGFLCLDTEDVPGNAAMKDQVAALRWVKTNIGNFGGDLDNVTIFGESAGASSVAYHLISPMSKGLFRKAIVQSGAATGHYAVGFEPRERAIALARKLGLDSDDDKDLYNFFKSQPKEKLILQDIPIIYSETVLHNNYGFPPVSEKDFGQERFFYGDTYFQTIQNGLHDGVDVMMGYVEDEAVLFLNSYETLDKDIEQMNNFRQALVPKILIRKVPIKDQLEIGRKMRKFYFNNKPVTRSDWEKVAKFMNFDMFVYHVVLLQKSCAKADRRKSYFYKFTCKSNRNFFKHVFTNGEVVGDKEVVCHCDELAYLFPIKFREQKVAINSKEFKLIERMTHLWTNFAKFGNPTPDSSLGVKWEPYCLQKQRYLNIGQELKLCSRPEDDEIHFWEGIFNQYMPKRQNI